MNDDFLKDFESRNWNASDGLPGNTITHLLQDSTGYIYIGTYDGLVRFDGTEFLTLNRNFDERYGFISTRTLFLDNKGNTWVGSNDEGVTCIAKDQTVRMFTMKDGLPNNSIRAITEDNDGNIWIGTACGIAYITPSLQIARPKGLDQYDEERILVASLYCDTAGRVWVTSLKPDSIFYFSDGRFSRYTGIRSIEHPVVNVINQDSRGVFWFGVSPHYAVRQDAGEETVIDIGHGGQKGTIVNSILPDKKGNVWFGLDSGVAILHNGQLSFYDESKGLSHNNVKCILEDREGNVWFATDRGGVEKISRTKFKTLPMSTTVNAISPDKDNGLMWVGGDDGLYCFDPKFNSVENDITRYCRNIRVRHVGTTRDGGLLVSTYEKFGQLLFAKDGTVTSWTKDEGLSGNKVRVAVEASDGDLYVGTTTGLNVIDRKSGAIRTYTQEDGLPNDYIMCIFEDSSGLLWFGTDGGGVFTMKDGAVRSLYSTANGLSGNVVFKISELRPGEIWFCTGSGVTRLKDGQFFKFKASDGLGTDSQFQMLTDYTERVWMTNNRGISSVRLSMMEDFADGKTDRINAKFFSRSDGIHSGGVTSTSLSAKDDLGRIWFTLIDGIVVYDPVKVTANKITPIVQIQSVTVDNETVSFDGNEIVLAPGAKRVNIKFTGISFISPEQMLFTYKLDGFDADFSGWNSSRTVSYTNLKPGRYGFSVKVLSSDDVESPLSETLVITKQPYFWQLWYFWLFVTVLCGTIVVLIIYGRFQHLRRYQQQLEKEVERKTSELKQKALDLEEEKTKSEHLLLNILPPPVAEELSDSPDKIIANQYDGVAVLFADIVGFTKLSSGLRATEIVRILNELFSMFDRRAQAEHVEKIKTIGDAYMAACGLADNADIAMSANQMIHFAFGMFRDLEEFNRTSQVQLHMRIGINSGSLVAGVIGKTKFIYDIWGDTVNVASRMESTGIPDKIHVTEATRKLTDKGFFFQGPVEIEIKGKGLMNTYFVKP